MSADLPDVEITVAAKSKAFRMFTERELLELSHAAWTGELQTYQKGDSNEFHALSQDYALVIKPEDESLVVITQMHQHADYQGEETYREIGSIKEVASINGD